MLFVPVIAAIAIGLSLISYTYSSVAISKISDVAASEARSNAKIQAHDLSGLLGERVRSVATNLETLASASSIQEHSVDRASRLLVAAENSTRDITYTYSWLDKDGKLLWSSSFEDGPAFTKFAGTDLSSREYFTVPRDSLQPYYSAYFKSIDGVPRVTISYPVLVKQASNGSSSGGFAGVILAAINVKTLGTFVQSQLSQNFNSSIGLLDRNGAILYSSSGSQFVGQNIFSPEVQSAVPSDIKDPFNQFIRDSLQGNTGAGDFSANGQATTVAYEPVTVKNNRLAVLYVVTPHQLEGNVISLIEQQRLLNIFIISAIGAVATGVAAVVVTWNRRLMKTVQQRTSELTASNASLKESNKLLAEANEMLQVHDKLQKEFVNVAAHELRTPIQPLLVAVELMAQQLEGKEKIEVTKPEMDMLYRNAMRLEKLSSDILQISRIDSGAFTLHEENFKLDDVFEQSISDARAQSNLNPNSMAISYVPSGIYVHADMEKVTEVIVNLLNNAIKFTKEGSISVTARKLQGDKFVEVSVTDTGTGIDPEVVPRMFEKFVTKSDRGTGIGLYVSKKIIEAHGGTIGGTNNIPGPGARFSFTIPLAPSQDITPSDISKLDH